VTSSSIYPLHHDTPTQELIAKYTAEHSRSAGRAGFLKIQSLTETLCPALYRLAPSESECEPKIVFPPTEQKRCCTENTAACSHGSA
jgi:hypothetical protein